MRTFDSGATRNSDDDKLDYEGFLNPLVLEMYASYMHRNRFLETGEVRGSDNWQLGLPLDVVMKSAYRHFQDWHLEHRGYESREGVKDALCGLLFNVQSYLLTVLEQERKDEESHSVDWVEPQDETEQLLLGFDNTPKIDPNTPPQTTENKEDTTPKIGSAAWFKYIIGRG